MVELRAARLVGRLAGQPPVAPRAERLAAQPAVPRAAPQAVAPQVLRLETVFQFRVSLPTDPSRGREQSRAAVSRDLLSQFRAT